MVINKKNINNDSDDESSREIIDNTLISMQDYIIRTFPLIDNDMKKSVIEHYKNEKYNAPIFQEIISNLEDSLKDDLVVQDDEEEL